VNQVVTGFRYSEDNRQDILKALRPREGADREAIIAKLAEAATRSIEARQRWKSIPNRRVVEDDLKQLTVTLNNLDREARRAVNYFLAKHRVSLDDVGEAAGRAASELAVRFPSGRGSKSTNPQAEDFLRHCATVWREYTDRRLPKSVKEGSPFAVFCEAAIPDELRTRKGANVTALINHVINLDYVRTRTRYF
jgi:hypothetical protein